MKSTLKRELKVREIVKREAIGASTFDSALIHKGVTCLSGAAQLRSRTSQRQVV